MFFPLAGLMSTKLEKVVDLVGDHPWDVFRCWD